MRLEQTIRDTVMAESMDLDGRLQQLVRAGLMPQNTLPVLRKAIARVQSGMALQGAERDVMATFINSMMYIVLGDDSIFNKARAGAKSYATEEVELDENASIVAHLVKRYGDNVRKSHVISAANDFGVDASKLSKAVRKHLGKTMLGEVKEKQEYDYEGDMAMSQLKSIIANSQRMHDMLSDDTNLPEWVQSKLTLAEDYISTAANYMQGEVNESKDDVPFEGPYRKTGERKDEYGNKVKNVAKHLAKKAMKANEEVEELDELSKNTMLRYVSANKKSDKSAQEKGDYSKTDKRMRGTDLAVRKYTAKDNKYVRVPATEETQIDEISKATMGRYINKAKDSIDMASYRSGIKDGTAISRNDPYTPKNPLEKKLTKRHKGISMAVSKLTKEESEQIDELSVGTLDKYRSKARQDIIDTPDSNEKRIDKRAGGYMAASRQVAKKLTKEESEQIDELSKGTLGRYIKKAAVRIGTQGVTAGLKIAADEKSKNNFDTIGKRERGIGKAVSKLTKESRRAEALSDINSVKQMNESYKDAFDNALIEYNVKSPSELDESKRKEFFNFVDQNYKQGDN